MMTSDVIAAVCHVLAEHLARSLAGMDGVRVTTMPPDAAQAEPGKGRLNLFLVQVAEGAGAANVPLRRVGLPADAAPPLALTFQYVVTLLGRDDLEERGTEAHRMLSAVLRLLHDEPVLPRPLILAVEPDLGERVDGIALRARPLALEEIGSLWAAFGVPYRLSVALEASCVLDTGWGGSPG